MTKSPSRGKTSPPRGKIHPDRVLRAPVLHRERNKQCGQQSTHAIRPQRCVAGARSSRFACRDARFSGIPKLIARINNKHTSARCLRRFIYKPTDSLRLSVGWVGCHRFPREKIIFDDIYGILKEVNVVDKLLMDHNGDLNQIKTLE